MGSAGKLALGVLACAAGSIAAMAQSAVISARSGLIHYVEGQVYLGDQLVETKYGVFPEVKEKQQLKTEEGRAEVLLTPGVFLRLGENSSFRMITNRLIDTRLEFQGGSAVVEAEEIGKDNSVTVVYKDATVHPVKKGVYRLDASNGELRVFDGEAEVSSNGDQTVSVKDGHSIALDTLAVRKFEKTSSDALNRWSERRASYVSMANVGAANSLRSSMFGGGSPFSSGWYWNSNFGMYSFVPGLGGDVLDSPYGYPYFSPFDVSMAYMPGFYYTPYPYGYYNNGYGNVYNTVVTKTIPTPSRPVGSTGSGSVGSVASGRAPSGGTYGTVLPSGSCYTTPGTSGPISHVGGGGGSQHK